MSIVEAGDHISSISQNFNNDMQEATKINFNIQSGLHRNNILELSNPLKSLTPDMSEFVSYHSIKLDKLQTVSEEFLEIS
jgi:hypothetical protein